MGLGNNNGRFAYVNIKRGQLAIKVEGEYKLYGFLEGLLTDIMIQDDEYQGNKFKILCLKIADGAETFLLQMRMESGYANGVCMALPNADLSLPVKFSPFFKEENGKNKSGMFLEQNGRALKWYWTKDNRGDLPLLVKTEFKGKTLWDNTEQQAYLTDFLLHKIKPSLSHPIMAGPSSDADHHPAAAFAKGPVTADQITEPIDDLPF